MKPNAFTPDQPISETTSLVSLFAFVVLPAGVFFSDIVVRDVNVSILYIAVIVGFGLLLPHRRLKHLAIMCATLTLVGYALKYFHTTGPEQLGYAGFRLINRTLTAGLLLLLVPMLSLVAAQLNIGPRNAESDSGSERRDDFDELARWAVPALLFALTLLLIVAVAVTDLILPRQFNLPLLYVVFLPVAALFSSRRLIWGLLLVLVMLTFAGYYVGPAPSSEPQPWWHLLITSRVLAASAMTLAAVSLDAWIVRRRAMLQQT